MAPASGRPHFLSRLPADWVLISTFLNRDVHNRAGERLGTVMEFYLGPDGQLTASALGVGRELGLGEKPIAIPSDASRIVRKDGGWQLVIDTIRESLQGAPAFEQDGGRLPRQR